MQEVTLGIAFIAGLTTFFAPCTFTALPSFLAYISARSLEGKKEGTKVKNFDPSIILSSIYYLIGFLSVFTLIGLSGTLLGSFLHAYKESFTVFGGVMIFLLGLFMLFGDRISKLRFLFVEKKLDLDPKIFVKGPFFPLIIGLTNAFAWTPCIGPILGVIIGIAGTSTSTFSEGALLLFSYGLGVSIPFVLIATFVAYSPKIVSKLSTFAGVLYKVNAVIIILIGMAFFLGLSNNLFGFLYQLFSSIGYTPK
jgi:cytochrome c-type biogenesis protein